MCKICNVFSNKCECSILCSVCSEMRSNKLFCKCDRQHVKLLATRIGKSLSGGSEEQSGQVNSIRFFGTEDYWFLGTIELGRSENYIKSLGRWVTRLLGH